MNNNTDFILSRLWKQFDLFREDLIDSETFQLILSVLFVRIYSLDKNLKKTEQLKSTTWGELVGTNVPGDYLGKLLKEIEMKNPVFKGISESYKFNRVDKKMNQLIHELLLNVDPLPLQDELDKGFLIDSFLQFFLLSSGKMNGEFSIPTSISLLIKNLTKGESFGIAYDPCIGSGTFLRFDPKVIKSFHGQEIHVATRSRSLMAHFIAGHRNFKIDLSDSLLSPLLDGNELKKFDLVISSPPFTVPIDNSKMEELKNDKWGRFRAGVSKDTNWAYGQHILSALSERGIGFLILPMGPLFSGGTNKLIREQLIRAGNIDTVIHLPAGLLTNTSIPVVLLILKKINSKNSPIFFVKADKLGKITRRERILSDDEILKISSTCIDRKEIAEFSRLVSFEEIIESDFTLNPLRFIEDKVIETRMDLDQVINNIEEANQAAEKSKIKIKKELESFGVNL